MKPITLVLKDCGVHYGLVPGACAKCNLNDHIRDEHRRPEQAAGFLAAINQPEMKQ